MNMKLLGFILLITISYNAASDTESNTLYILDHMHDTPIEDQFQAFHYLFKRDYAIDSQEGIERYMAFKSNVEFINNHNALGERYKLGPNQFLDWTDAEIQKKLSNVEARKDEIEKITKTQQKETEKKGDNVDNKESKPPVIPEHDPNFFDTYADEDEGNEKTVRTSLRILRQVEHIQDDEDVDEMKLKIDAIKKSITDSKNKYFDNRADYNESKEELSYFDKYADEEVRLLRRLSVEEDEDEMKLKIDSIHKTIQDPKNNYFNQHADWDERYNSNEQLNFFDRFADENRRLLRNLIFTKQFLHQEEEDEDERKLKHKEKITQKRFVALEELDWTLKDSSIANSPASQLSSRKSLSLSSSIDYCASFLDSKCTLETYHMLLSKGPLSSGIYVNKKFLFYRSGVLVFDDSECGEASTQDITVVGYKFDTLLSAHLFKIKNTWGSSWGENGFAMIAYNPASQTETCQLLEFGEIGR